MKVDVPPAATVAAGTRPVALNWPHPSRPSVCVWLERSETENVWAYPSAFVTETLIGMPAARCTLRCET